MHQQTHNVPCAMHARISRRFRDVVFKHGTVLRWQASGTSGTLQALDLLPVLLSKFTAAGGSSITELHLDEAQLTDEHCQLLADAALSGALARLHVLTLAQSTPHSAMLQMMLGILLGHCRHLNRLDLSATSSLLEHCTGCKMLRAALPPSDPYIGLKVLRLARWSFTGEQLCALHDALLKSLPALIELDLRWWSWVPEASSDAVRAVGAALTSGNLKTLDVCCYNLAPDSLQAQAAQVLQSHTCTLTGMAVWNLIMLPQLLVPVLAYNSQVELLAFSCVSAPGDNAAARNSTQVLLQMLGRLTCLKVLDLEIQQAHDPAPALRRLTGLTELTISGLSEAGVLGPHNAGAMADALRAMPHLRRLSLCSHCFDSGEVTGIIPAAVAAEVLQGCSAQLSSLECHVISVAAEQPSHQLARLSAAVRRLTNLKVLKVPNLVWNIEDTFAEDQYALAAAAVASALPSLPALTELDVGHRYEHTQYSSTFRSAAFSIVFSACLVPCLSHLTMPRWLSDADRAGARCLLKSSHPGMKVLFG